MKRTTNFFVSLFAVALISMPLLGWGAGERTPGYVTVNATYLFGIYNVRYNSAVTKGKVGYQLDPGVVLAVTGTDSSTGQNFTCTMARVENAIKFDKMGKGLLSITHGSWITATRVSTSDGHCNTLQIAGGSNFLE
jgi:TctA family transporter